MADFNSILAMMAANPPDPNASTPTSNRKETIYGATVPFQVLTLSAVAFRLYTRFRIIREPGWDDYFVILAAVFNLAALICFYGAIPHGLGEHLLLLNEKQINMIMMWLYVQGACYYTTTTLIKVSLLCQYLRLFRTGLLRKFCQALLLLVSLWGAGYMFMAWFPCFPVSGFWDRMQTPPPKCYGFGFGTVSGAAAAFISFGASNMVIDTIIFLIPLTVYFRDGLNKKQVFAFLGLFTLGSVVVLMSVLRLWTTLKNNGSEVEKMDFTYWYPLTLIISCIEVDFAIMCASMPIFWPVMLASMKEIFVTQEVRVTHHHRLDGSADFEMNDRPNSLKSSSSQEGLTKLGHEMKTDYSDPYVVQHVTGKIPALGEVQVGVTPKKKRRLWSK